MLNETKGRTLGHFSLQMVLHRLHRISKMRPASNFPRHLRLRTHPQIGCIASRFFQEFGTTDLVLLPCPLRDSSSPFFIRDAMRASAARQMPLLLSALLCVRDVENCVIGLPSRIHGWGRRPSPWRRNSRIPHFHLRGHLGWQVGRRLCSVPGIGGPCLPLCSIEGGYSDGRTRHLPLATECQAEPPLLHILVAFNQLFLISSFWFECGFLFFLFCYCLWTNFFASHI